MTDYLGRLSERALGIANLVQPAIAPLFATERLPRTLPKSEDEWNGRKGDRQTEFPQLEDSTIIAPIFESAPLVPSILNGSSEKIDNSVNPTEAIGISSRAAKPSVSFRPESFQKPEASLAAKTERSDTGNGRQLEPEKRATPLQGDRIAPSAISLASDIIAISDRISTINQPDERAVKRVEVDSVGSTPIKLAPHRASREAEDFEPGADGGFDSGSQKLRTQLRTLAATNTPRTQQSEQHAPAPIVRINIGRIEVRAIRPLGAPAPQPRREPARPSVTLGDYLTKKRGAGR
jgi:hypothetical protein